MCLHDRAMARCLLFCSSCIPTILNAWLRRALCSGSAAAAKASLGVVEGRGDVVKRPRAIVGLEDAPGGAPRVQVWVRQVWAVRVQVWAVKTVGRLFIF